MHRSKSLCYELLEEISFQVSNGNRIERKFEIWREGVSEKWTRKRKSSNERIVGQHLKELVEA